MPAFWLATLGKDAVYALSGGVLAFVMVLAEVRVVGLASGLTLSVLGVAKEFITITISVVGLREPFSRLNAAGLTLCAVGIVAYQRLRLRAASARP